MYYSVIYQSKAQDNFSPKDIELMLIKAKRKNKKHKITGCIVYSGNKFIQMIQGPKQEITDLYKDIKADNRHFSVITLLEKASKEKIWSDWSMAMLNFSGGSKQVMSSRILLESYFETANKAEKKSEVFEVLRSNVLDLINESN
ncbi:BLUF domain-containing protein [Winogradskyella ludwigii]|uniref:BLUF domain-containing protein n=1 Tax=Winogradskyella ludwigii TaxID=2686076 RepID=UPI0015C8F1DA|nr:BLUF domain-containing protein [Winogradskyella ludwigii]